MPKDLRILHVFDHSLPLQSGYSFRSVALLREQRRRGWITSHLTTPKHTHPGPSPEIIDGFLFHRTPSLGNVLQKIPFLREMALIRAVAKRLEDVAAAERPDVLHAHSPVLNALACLMAARRLRLPVVYEVRAFWEDAAVDQGTASEGGLRYRLTRALETYAMRRCDGIAPICDGLRSDILKRGIAPELITMIPNGVDVNEFPFHPPEAAGLRVTLGLEDRIVLGFIGSFYAYEGLDLLLAALPEILRQWPNVAVLLVGGGPAESALKNQVQSLNLSSAVRFCGRVPHDVVQDYYSLVDIFVYPRHAMRLTNTVTPLKPLEAMARGGIVLASDVGGHRELLRDGDTGFLFPADDVRALSLAIQRLIANRLEWSRMRHTARRFVESERTWAAASRGYEELYGRAIKAHANAIPYREH